MNFLDMAGKAGQLTEGLQQLTTTMNQIVEELRQMNTHQIAIHNLLVKIEAHTNRLPADLGTEEE